MNGADDIPREAERGKTRMIRVREVGTYTVDQAHDISEGYRAYATLSAPRSRRELHARLTQILACNPRDTLNAASKVDKTYRIWNQRSADRAKRATAPEHFRA